MTLGIGARPTTTFRPEPGKVDAEQLKKIPCPNLRTLVNEGWLTPDKDGLVDLKQLDSALQRLGVTALPRMALVRGAKGATAEVVAKEFGDMASGKFNIFRLTGSRLDHAGDTQVLRGGFNQQRLDWLLSYANADGRIGKKELARAQEDMRNTEPTTFRDKALGVAELVAALQVYGTKDKNGYKSLSKEGVTDLWKHSKFPAEWKAQLKSDGAGGVTNADRTGLGALLMGVVDMAFRQLGTVSGRSSMAMEMATGRDPQLNQTSAMGLGLAMCPAGPPTAAAKKDANTAHGAA